MHAGELAEIATHLAALGADMIRAGGSQVEVAATKSSAVDVVTAMDVAVENAIRAELARLRPQDGYLGEESGQSLARSQVTWVVDPIDGTVNYLYGLPGYAVSVAAVTGPVDPARWTIQAGTVHAVAERRVWSAWRGGGATLDGEPITGPPPRSLATSLVGTGFGYQTAQRAGQAQVVAQLLPACRDIRRRGGAAVDLCTVASGGLDLYYERYLNLWDFAAGAIVASEAGLEVTGLQGCAPGPDMVVVGRGENLAELVKLLQELGADRPLR